MTMLCIDMISNLLCSRWVCLSRHVGMDVGVGVLRLLTSLRLTSTVVGIPFFAVIHAKLNPKDPPPKTTTFLVSAIA